MIFGQTCPNPSNVGVTMNLSLKRCRKLELLFLADASASLGHFEVEKKRDLLCEAPAGLKLVSGEDVRVKGVAGWPKVSVQ